MDAPQLDLILVITGTWLVARICRHSFVARRKHYVTAGNPHYMRLQASFNAACSWSVFTALAVMLVQPAMASLLGGPSGWAALLAGLLTVLGVFVEPFRRLGIGLDLRDPIKDVSESGARMHREIVRARSDLKVLLAVVPFFIAVAALIVTQAQGASTRGSAAYATGFLLGLVHVYAAMNAVFSWRALGTLQRELRVMSIGGRTSQPTPASNSIPAAVLLAPVLLADDASEDASEDAVDPVECVDVIVEVLDTI